MNHATSFRYAAALVVATVAAMPAGAARPDGGRVFTAAQASDHVSVELDRRLAAEATRNIEMLRREGRLPAMPPKVSGLVWPLGPVAGAGTAYHGISNFVDLDPAYPDKVLDYNGGARTYDTASGYNHRGIDYFIWPFSWMLMDQGAVDVRAAAAGTLVGKDDGNGDRSCDFSAPDTPNYVTVRHADGTIARYLHMKNGSVTTRPIGSAIAAGEVLGKVGSSGVSTGPHLHLELRANESAGAANIEPHTGPNNPSPSAWVQQRPYRDSAINRLSTHSAPPVFAPCNGTTVTGTDTPNFKNAFMPGEDIYYLAAFRDQGKGQVGTFRVLRPDLTVENTWTVDSGSNPSAPDFYNASYWYWKYKVPAAAPHGLWTLEATYQGKTTRHRFRVGNTTQAINDMRGLIGAWFEPATAGQGLEFHWINSTTALLFFYGHQDDGENFFLLGQRNAPFDFNQEVTFSMYRTLGGRWNDLDPALIQRPTWGTLNITFIDCEHAVAELDGTDGTQVLTLERLGRTEGLGCD